MTSKGEGVIRQMKLMKPIVIVIILVGLGLITTAFIDSPWQLQIATALVGIGFICLGLMQLKRARERTQDEERFDQIMTKLEQLQQELEKKEESKGTGVVIADVISSGLKYYSEYMTRQKKEDE